jgi:hypothetical protein
VCLSPNDDTTACLSGIFLSPAKAAAAFERVDAIARDLKRDRHARTLDQVRADVFCDFLAGVDCGASPIARPGVVELLVPLETLTRQTDAPAKLAEAAVAERGQAIGEWLASRWRYRVYDRDGQLLYAGSTRARPDFAEGDASPPRADATPRRIA